MSSYVASLTFSILSVHVFIAMFVGMYVCMYICVHVCFCVYVYVCTYVTLSHLRSKAQAVVHNLCTTLVVDQNIHTTGIHHQQQQNKPTTTPECN